MLARLPINASPRVADILRMPSAAYLKHLGGLQPLLIKADMSLMSAEIKRGGMDAAETANLKSKLNFATDLYAQKAANEFNRSKKYV